jgi:hypothetical protein
VIHCFAPSRTQLAPRRVARVVIAAASLPAWGSESANAPPSHSADASLGRQRRLCASVPYRATISATLLVTPIVTAVAQSARAISASARAYATGPASEPPYSDGTFTASSPSSPRPRTRSSGKRARRSFSAAAGATFSRAKRRADSWTARSTSVGSRFIQSFRTEAAITIRWISLVPS